MLSSPRRRLLALYLLTLLVAACSILYELVLAQTLAALLGNSVMRYSVTIGCYLGALGLGAMLCGTGTEPARVWRRLARVELGLSVVGGASVPMFYLLDALQSAIYYGDGALAGSSWIPVAFMVATHALILAIGVLSGYEVPLLLALGEAEEPGSTHRVLGVDYLGSLIGSLLFPTLLLPVLGVMTTALAVALMNGVACVALVAAHDRRRLAAPLLVVVALALALPAAGRLEQHFLIKYYYPQDVQAPRDVLAPASPDRAVERRRSPYQSIDLFYDDDPRQWFADILSARRRRRPDYPDDFWVYLDGEQQFFSGDDEFYHEWFAHAAVQLAGEVPREVLVLGGGDGLLVAELLRYPQLESVVHVELDAEMIRLAREHPALSTMNGRPDLDARVELIEDDALRWLRRSRRRFDAIYIDMPLVRDYDHSKVYSREFYALARVHLRPRGFVMLDAPGADCLMRPDYWSRYSSTLAAAGFTPRAVLSRVTLDAPPLRERVEHAQSYSYHDERERLVRLTGEAAKAALRDEYTDALTTFAVHEFIFAFARERAPNLEWRDHGVRLDAFGPAYLEDALMRECEPVRDPALVNSIARPTLPPARLLTKPRAP